MELVRWCSDRETAVFLDGAEHGGFESRERKVEVGDFGMGKFVSVRITIFGTLGNGRTAGVGKTEDFGDFVEAFADGVVASGTNNLEMIMLRHVDNLGVAAGDN